MNVIETRKLTRDFGHGKGILNLDLSIAKGRVHGFLGPNGAGKTTVIRLLMDYLRPDRGGSRVLGMNPVTQAHQIRRQVGFVPGDLAMPTMLTGREFLAQSEGMRGHVDHDWRKHLIHLFGAELQPRIGNLSKGNKQKIALIDALQHRPPLLIMDEPTDGLDPLLRDQVRMVLRDHAKKGGTVFLSSHVVHEIQTMCDDVSIVLSGRLRRQARIEDLVAMEGMRVEVAVDDPKLARQRLEATGAVKDFAKHNGRMRFRIQGDPLPALATLHDLGARDPKLRQGDLEEMFLRMYAEDRA